MNEELIAKARSAKSAEDLLALAKENGMELDEDSARAYFEQLNKSGELSDDELDNVSGGGCQTKVGGEKHTVVTNYCKCFMGGRWEYFADDKIPIGIHGDVMYIPKPGAENRGMIWGGVADGCCGSCIHLGFKSGLGYCKIG